jgi:hypothetical protein
MSDFPKLKTGAVMQYPASRELRFSNTVLRFVDGSEQRYRVAASALRRWTVQLTGLDEGEMGAIEQFFLTQQGACGSFTFTDPWSGTTYADCSFDGDTVELTSIEELQGKTSLTIRENRT